MKFDNLADLRLLLAIADTGSLSAAARRSGLGASAVSAAVKRLEAALDARLFERTTRSVNPTREGRIMIDHARRALDVIAEGQARVREAREGLNGSIRIASSSTMAHNVLAAWLAGFSQLHPGVEIDLRAGDEHLDLVKEGIDLAVRYGPLPDSELVARLLVPAHRIACASPEYLARHGVPEEPLALAHHECITYLHHGRQLDTWAFTPAHDDAAMTDQVCKSCDVRVNGRFSCDTASIALRWAEENLGIVYMPTPDLGDTFARGRLIDLFPGYKGMAAPLYAVMPSRRFVPDRVKVLLDELARYLVRPAEALATSGSPPAPVA